jgi:putative transposase
MTPDQIRIRKLKKGLREWRKKRNTKQGYRSLDVRLTEQFSLVKELKETHAVSLVCDVFGVHRRRYKYWLDHPKTPSRERVKLLGEVRAVHKDSNGSAGVQTVATIVNDRGTPLSRYRAVKLMKEHRLVSCQMPRHRYKKVN